MSVEPKPHALHRATFEALFENHHRVIYAYALRRTRSEADAEDATAETFATAWRRIDAVPADPLPWLYAVARRVLANQYRGRERRLRLLDRLRLLQPTPPASAATEGPAMAALQSLRHDDQELLKLVAWESLRQTEIAAVLGITTNAVAIRLHRARRRFAAALAEAQERDAKGSFSRRTSGGVMGRDAVVRSQEEAR